MKISKEYIILAVIIIVLAGYLVVKKNNGTHYRLPDLPELQVSDITELTIKKSDVTVDLKKKDDRWVIMPQMYPANEDKVRDMLNAAGSLSVTALVSDRGDDPAFSLDPDHRIHVTVLKNGKVVRSFYIGSVVPSYHHTFVRLQGSKNVYHAKGNLKSIFDTTVDDLRDKTVLSFNVSDIKEIRIAKGKVVTILSLSEQKNGKKRKDHSKGSEAVKAGQVIHVWKDAKGKVVDKEKVKRLLVQLSDLKCRSYIQGKSKKDYTHPIYSITLKGNKEYRLSIFAPTDKKSFFYPAVSSENQYPFILAKYAAEEIMKKLD